MTNVQSIAGTMLWAAVAAVLMLATFEPVSVGSKTAVEPSQIAGASAPASQA